MSEEPLVYIPSDRWSELQNVFKTEWTRSFAGYAVLEAQRNLIKNGFDYGFKVYCPFGDLWNGMVAINIKDQYYEIIIQCPRDDTEKLEDALRRTKIVNWQRSIIVPFAQYHVIECLQRALGNHVEVYLLKSEAFILDKRELFEDIVLPPGISFDLISSEYLDLVDSTWPHRYASSRWYFKLLIDIKLGFGLFKDNELVTWVFYDECGKLLHFYTVEDHRRKGYAELILKLVCNIFIKQSKPVIASCLVENLNACNLYKKVGFTKSRPIAWCYINKDLL